MAPSADHPWRDMESTSKADMQSLNTPLPGAARSPTGCPVGRCRESGDRFHLRAAQITPWGRACRPIGAQEPQYGDLSQPCHQRHHGHHDPNVFPNCPRLHGGECMGPRSARGIAVAATISLVQFHRIPRTGGFATPDDVEAIEKCQTGLRRRGRGPYNDISKACPATAGPLSTMKCQMRAFWTEWDRRLAKSES